MEEDKDSKKYLRFSDFVKDKIIEFGADYFKKNTQFLKNQISKQIEKTIEKKIKSEIRNLKYNITILILALLAFAFILFAIISMMTFYLELPKFANSFIFGFILLIISIIVYLMK
jgi:uncharacterized membrane protein